MIVVAGTIVRKSSIKLIRKMRWEHKPDPSTNDPPESGETIHIILDMNDGVYSSNNYNLSIIDYERPEEFAGWNKFLQEWIKELEGAKQNSVFRG
jgi:hypothetical protein